MKEFSNLIDLYPVDDISNANPEPWNNERIGLNSFMADDFSFDPTQSESESGSLYDCSVTFIIESPSTSVVTRFSTPVSSVLILRDTSGLKYPIGTKNIPGTALIQKGIQKSRLIFKCNSLSNPI